MEITEEDGPLINKMVEAVLYSEAALIAAKIIMLSNQDYRGAELMQQALDKVNIALPLSR